MLQAFTGEFVAGRFATTRWTLVLRARDASSTESRLALAELCEAYWYPLYSFVRRDGHGPENAMDLTQGFFATLLEKDYLQDVRPEAGRFRTFLLTSLKHFLFNDWDRRKALKRGGDRQIVSLDAEEAERKYSLEPVDPETPEDLYKRRWALTVLDRTLDRLEEDYTSTGRGEQFQRLSGFLLGSQTGTSYRDAGEVLGIRVGAVKVAVHRLRKRFGSALREEISDTVGSAADIEDEIKYLLSVANNWEPVGSTRSSNM